MIIINVICKAQVRKSIKQKQYQIPKRLELLEEYGPPLSLTEFDGAGTLHDARGQNVFVDRNSFE